MVSFSSMKRLSPSILSADFSRLADEVKRLESFGIKEIHLDVMDGHFVPNITIGPPVIASLRKETEMFFDTHLMITNPAKYFESFLKAGADGITCHVEVEECLECIRMAKKEGIRAGISLNPETPVDAVLPYLDKVDMVLVMSVHPGFGGQKFMPEVLPKVKKIRKFIDEEGIDTIIQIDGGINVETAPLALDAGVDILVSGSGVFRGNVEENIKNLNDIIKKFSGKG